MPKEDWHIYETMCNNLEEALKLHDESTLLRLS
jgi:hypothetical protein